MLHRFNGTANSSGLAISITATSVVGAIYQSSSTNDGLFSVVFTATQVNHWVFLETGTGVEGVYSEFDNVSVREVLGNQATQPTTANKPIIASLPNGKRAMKFDGVNNLLNLGPGAVLSNASDHWVCAAVRFSDITGGIRAIYTCSNPSSLTPLVCDVELSSAGRLQAYWRDDAANVAVLQGPTAVVNTPYVITACKIGVNRFLWVNGILQWQTAVNPGVTNTTVATIGALIRTSTQYYFPGELAVSVGQSTLSDTDRRTIERYLAQQIGAAYAG